MGNCRFQIAYCKLLGIAGRTGPIRNLKYAICNSRVLLLALLLLLPLAAARSGAAADAGRKPVVLVFDMSTGTGADADFAAQATQDLKSSLRETNRVDAVQYDPSSPVIERAVLEKTLTREQAASPTTPDLRAKLAKLFGVQYFADGDLAVSDSNVDVTLAITEVDTGRKWVSHQRATMSSIQTGDSKRDLNNARVSAIRTAMTQIAQEAFVAIPIAAPEPAAANLAPPTQDTGDMDEKILGELMVRVDRYLAENNLVSALSELKRAENANPKALGPRIKLADVYMRQKRYDQAIDELKRARDLAPGNRDVLKPLAEAFEAQGSLAEAATAYEALLTGAEPPRAAELRIKLGDLYWKNANIEDAVGQYKSAAEADPKNPMPHLRLARVFAAKAQFADALKEIEIAVKLTPEGAPVMDSEAFQGFLKVADAEIRAIYAQYQISDAEYRKGDKTREDYRNTSGELGDRATALAAFLDKIPAPDEFRSSKSHRVLGLTLLSQATASLATFLETDDEDSRADSTLLISEAVKEFQTAFDLDKETLRKVR